MLKAKKVIKYFSLFISFSIILRILMSNDKELITCACVYLFSVPFIYNEKNNIFSFIKVIEKKAYNLKEKI